MTREKIMPPKEGEFVDFDLKIKVGPPGIRRLRSVEVDRRIYEFWSGKGLPDPVTEEIVKEWPLKRVLDETFGPFALVFYDDLGRPFAYTEPQFGTMELAQQTGLRLIEMGLTIKGQQVMQVRMITPDFGMMPGAGQHPDFRKTSAN